MATKEERFSRLKSLFLFRKTVFFIAGLIFAHSLVKYAVLVTMIIYLTADWKESNLPKAVIILNAQEGLSKVLMIFEAHMADAYFGRFYVIVFSSLSMIAGLMLLWVVDPAKNLGVFWGVAVLIALGEAGKEPPLKAFLANELKEGENKATAGADELKEGENKATAGADESKEEGNKPAVDKCVKACMSVSELSVALASTLLLDENKNAEQQLLYDRVRVWWSLFKVLGALVGTFGLGSILGAICGLDRKDYWGPIFVAPAIVMGVSLIIFLLGYPFYQPEEQPRGERSPIWAMLKVFTTAFHNRGFQYSEKSTDYYEYHDGGKIPLSPDIPLSRWVDKAALIVETSPPSAKEEGNKEKRPCTAAQVKKVKQILRMVPMWATFVVYCITQATGSTLFFEQTANLDNSIGKYKVPLVSFYLMQASSSNGIMYLSNLVISKCFKGDKKLFAYKVRIGLGMACSCLACVAAMLVEKNRLKKFKDYQSYQSPDGKTTFSIFQLTPQFILLGLAEGLTEEGLEDFFNDQVVKSLKSYGLPFNQFAMGLGKFFNIFLVLIFHGWFGKTINTSRLDKYYRVLAILGSCNLFVVYTFVSIFFYKDAKLWSEVELG